jgi:hypothetical protein
MRKPFVAAAAALVVLVLYLVLREDRALETTPPLKAQPPPASAELVEARARHQQDKTRENKTRASDLFPRVLVKEDTSFAAVLEVSALATSTIGVTLADCLGLHDEGGPLAPLKQLGIDPLRDLDRLAVTKGGALFSGNFGALPAMKLGERYGEHGRIFALREETFGMRYAGAWGDGVLFAFESKEQAQRAIDRLENRLPAGTPLVPEAEAYGDVYGSIDVQSLASELLPLGSDASLPSGQAVFHLDLEQRLYQSVELPIGREDRARIKQSIERFVAEKKRVLHTQASMPMTEHLDEALDGVVATDFEDSLRVEATFPTEHLTRWFSSCKFGLPHAPPPGWSSTKEPLIAAFSGPAPAGLVSLKHNEDKLKQTYPQLAELYRDLGTDPARMWFDPVSLQTMTFNQTVVPGVCARSAKLEAHPLSGKVESIKDTRGRTWRRASQLDEQTGTRSLDYRYCDDDHLWSVSVGIQKLVLESVAQARAEAYLGNLELNR